MGHTVVGIFRYSGDADLAAAHLRDAYTLDEDRLDIMEDVGWGGDDGLYYYADPLMRRWGDMPARGRTVLVARSDDPDEAVELAREMRRAGAERVDLLQD